MIAAWDRLTESPMRTDVMFSVDRDPDDETVARRFNEWIAGAQLPEPKDVHVDYAKVEVVGRLQSYQRTGSSWRIAQVAIWLFTAFLGLLGAALAVTDAEHTVAVVAGGLVATLTTFTQAAHPGRQADGYENARLAIRDEAWDLLTNAGDYEGLTTDEERFKHFAEEIRDIVRLKRTVTQFQLS
jgi:hypothetical protein